MKNTQGNWKVSSTGFGRSCRKFVIQDNEYSCLIAETQGDSLDEAMANAHLISASPDMYEALKAANRLIEVARGYFPKSIKNNDKFYLENTCSVVGNALIKAEGK